mmetsp:Transcript_28739/g.65128  ORF Transcript_28739/g.65128 Transcript_28739/m.65128 type:complete len:233 (+) Transcript_28739:933-1631(+)
MVEVEVEPDIIDLLVRGRNDRPLWLAVPIRSVAIPPPRTFVVSLYVSPSLEPAVPRANKDWTESPTDRLPDRLRRCGWVCVGILAPHWPLAQRKCCRDFDRPGGKARDVACPVVMLREVSHVLAQLWNLWQIHGCREHSRGNCISTNLIDIWTDVEHWKRLPLVHDRMRGDEAGTASEAELCLRHWAYHRSSCVIQGLVSASCCRRDQLRDIRVIKFEKRNRELKVCEDPLF